MFERQDSSNPNEVAKSIVEFSEPATASDLKAVCWQAVALALTPYKRKRRMNKVLAEKTLLSQIFKTHLSPVQTMATNMTNKS